MKVVILGAGQVGATLAESLARDQHDISVIDNRSEHLQELQRRLDIRTVLGHASYPNILRKAGIEDADMLIATTASDEVNMIACQVAHSLFRTPHRIARIRSPNYFIRRKLFGDNHLPIDAFINPEQLVTDYIHQLVLYPGAMQVVDFAGGRLKMVSVKPYYGGLAVGKTLAYLHQQLPEARVVGIFRDNELIALSDKTQIEVGDEVFFMAAAQHVPVVMAALRRVEKNCEHIMIAGGGHIGCRLAAQLEQNYHVKLLDHTLSRCEQLAYELNQTTVLCGDASDKELLINENIEHVDIFCAITNDDEANIMSCIQAKRLGAKYAMALINRTTYVELIADEDINVVINPQHITVGGLLAFVHKGDLHQMHSLRRIESVAVEAVVPRHSNSTLTGQAIATLPLSSTVRVGGIIRDREVIIPNPSTILKGGDNLILFVGDKKQLPELEKLFQG